MSLKRYKEHSIGDLGCKAVEALVAAEKIMENFKNDQR